MKTADLAQEYALFYETLLAHTPKENYALFFDEDSHFEDPFQKVQGLEAIHAIFVDMYSKLHNPRFIIGEVVCSDEVAYIKWDFIYAMTPKNQEQSFTGVSRVTFSKNGKIATHTDYWDAGQHVYEKIPLLGSLIRLIKRKLHA